MAIEFPVSEELRIGAAVLPQHGSAAPQMRRWAQRVQELERIAAAARAFVGDEPINLYINNIDGPLTGALADPKWKELVVALAEHNADNL